MCKMVNLAQKCGTGCAVAASLRGFEQAVCTSLNGFMQPTRDATAVRKANNCTAPIRSVRYFNI